MHLDTRNNCVQNRNKGFNEWASVVLKARKLNKLTLITKFIFTLLRVIFEI